MEISVTQINRNYHSRVVKRGCVPTDNELRQSRDEKLQASHINSFI